MIGNTTYTLMVFAHVVAAILLVGSSMFAPLIRASIRAAPTVGDLRTWLGFARKMGSLNPAASLIVLATGLYLGSLGWWRADWYRVALGGFVVNMVLAVRVMKPMGMNIARALSGPPTDPVPEAADRQRRARHWDLAADAMLANDLALLFIMQSKPALPTSLAIVAVSHMAVAIVARLVARLGARALPSAVTPPA